MIELLVSVTEAAVELYTDVLTAEREAQPGGKPELTDGQMQK